MTDTLVKRHEGAIRDALGPLGAEDVNSAILRLKKEVEPQEGNE